MKRLGIATVVFVIAIVVVWMVVDRPGPPEPVYQGQTLTEWLGRLKDVNPDYIEVRARAKQEDVSFTACRNALLAMGTNVIPCLMEDLQATDPKIGTAVEVMIRCKVIGKALPDKWFRDLLHFSYLGRKYVIDEHLQACCAFMVLGTNAATAWPQLIKLTGSADLATRIWGLEAFVCSEPPKEICMPVILRLLKDTDEGVRYTAARQLTELYPEEIETNNIYNLFPSLRPGYITHAE